MVHCRTSSCSRHAQPGLGARRMGSVAAPSRERWRQRAAAAGAAPRHIATQQCNPWPRAPRAAALGCGWQTLLADAGAGRLGGRRDWGEAGCLTACQHMHCQVKANSFDKIHASSPPRLGQGLPSTTPHTSTYYTNVWPPLLRHTHTHTTSPHAPSRSEPKAIVTPRSCAKRSAFRPCGGKVAEQAGVVR